MFARFQHTILVLGLAAIAVSTGAFGKPAPVRFAFEFKTPDGIDKLFLPTSMWVDARHDEVFVVDAGNSRIVIFDHSGSYLFEVTDRRNLLGPQGVAVDSLGRMFVFCQAPQPKVVVLDYDGTFLYNLVLTDSQTDLPISASSILFDGRDRLFALDGDAARVYVYSSHGQPLYDFAVFQEFGERLRNQPVLGAMAVVNDELIIPMPAVPLIARYTLDGQPAGSFGVPGNGAGEFSFPVSAASDGRGGICVLDRNRHAVLRFDDDGKFIEEWGGLGQSAGWFYMPNMLAAGDAGRLFVLQSFQERVQAFDPNPVRDVPETELSTAGQPGSAALPKE